MINKISISNIFQVTAISEENSNKKSLNETIAGDDRTEQSSVYTSALDKSYSLAEIYAQTSSEDYVISDAEDNEVPYIVYLEPTDNEVILVVSDISMKEKDSFNGRYD